MEYLRKPLMTLPQLWKPLRCAPSKYCSKSANSGVTSRERRTATADGFKAQISSGPSFQDFIRGVSARETRPAVDHEGSEDRGYVPDDWETGNSRKGQSASLRVRFTGSGGGTSLLNCVCLCSR